MSRHLVARLFDDLYWGMSHSYGRTRIVGPCSATRSSAPHRKRHAIEISSAQTFQPKQFVSAQNNLVRHCSKIHNAAMGGQSGEQC
jgi:hypothetical protein